MHGKKERKQNMMQLCNLFYMIRHESHNRGTNYLIACGDSVCRLILRVQRVNDGLLSLILVVNYHLTKASITSMQLLTHMLICTNTVSCLKMNWNLDALFFRLKIYL